MEHRYGRRIDVGLRAIISKRGLIVGRGQIKNGSQYGLFLETDYTDVNVLQKLVIEVSLHPAPQKTLYYQLQTIVVRKSGNGLGLELETIGEQDSRAMVELIAAVSAVEKPAMRTQRIKIAT